MTDCTELSTGDSLDTMGRVVIACRGGQGEHLVECLNLEHLVHLIGFAFVVNSLLQWPQELEDCLIVWGVEEADITSLLIWSILYALAFAWLRNLSLKMFSTNHTGGVAWFGIDAPP